MHRDPVGLRCCERIKVANDVAVPGNTLAGSMADDRFDGWNSRVVIGIRPKLESLLCASVSGQQHSKRGLLDVVASNKNGTFVFIQTVREASQEEWEKAQPVRIENFGE